MFTGSGFFPCRTRIAAMYRWIHRYEKSGIVFYPDWRDLTDDAVNGLLMLQNLRAIKLAAEGQTTPAMNLLALSENRNPAYYHTYLVRAAILYGQGQIDSALAEYTHLEWLFRRSPALLYNRGLLYRKAGKTAQALADIRQALEWDPFLPDANRLAAEILFSAKAYGEAIPYFTRSLQSLALPSGEMLEKVQSVPPGDRGRARNTDTPLPAMGAEIRKGVEILFQRGQSFGFRGDILRASRDYSQALELDSGYTPARKARLLAYRSLGNWQGMASDLAALEEESGSKPRFLAMEAELAYHQGKREDACRLLAELNRQAPGYMDTYLKHSERDWHDPRFVKEAFFTAAHPLRILLIGDSMAGGALRIVLEDLLKERDGIDYSYEYKVSSGLSNDWYFDWQEKIEEILAAGSYDLIMIMLGTNDGQAILEKRVLHQFGSGEWNSIYRRRLQLFLKTIATGTPRVYWLGLPPMGNPAFHRKMEKLNIFFSSACALFPNTTFISTFSVLGEEEGKFEKYINVNGEELPTRFGDNIHFRLDGVRPLVEFLLNKLKQDYLLPSLYSPDIIFLR